MLIGAITSRNRGIYGGGSRKHLYQNDRLLEEKLININILKITTIIQKLYFIQK